MLHLAIRPLTLLSLSALSAPVVCHFSVNALRFLAAEKHDRRNRGMRL